MTLDITEVSGFDLVSLCFVAGKYEPDVTALKEEMNDWYGSDLPYERVYQSLERLERQGLVEKHQLDGRGNCYMLTETGAKAVTDHRKLVETRTEQLI